MKQVLLGISTSLKQEKSASREYLKAAMAKVSLVYPHTEILDLAATNVPGFQGLVPLRNEDRVTKDLLVQIQEAACLLITVPAYWSGVSGVFKNLIDVLCGPCYNMAERATVFTSKPVGIIVVGSDEASARNGVLQAKEILLAIGANLIEPIVKVDDPRDPNLDFKELEESLLTLAGTLALIAARSERNLDKS